MEGEQLPSNWGTGREWGIAGVQQGRVGRYLCIQTWKASARILALSLLTYVWLGKPLLSEPLTGRWSGCEVSPGCLVSK